MPRFAAWPVLAAATAAVAVALGAAGMESPSLFGALLVGMAAALRFGSLPEVPAWGFRAAQAVTGVALGAYVRSSALREVAHAWFPVAVVVAGTLALSLGGGVALSRLTGVDRATAALGSVAGGASGIVSMADDLGADDRLVAFMQYLRVFVVVLLTPLLVGFAFGGGSAGGAAPGGTAAFATAGDWALTLGICAAGGLLASAVGLAAGSLLGPMLLAAAVVLAGAGLDVPPVLREPAFALIGLQVGLRFTPGTLRQAGRLFLPALLGVLALLVACFGLALILAATTSENLLSAYLATTPGGLYAVLAAAFGSGADTTFILAVQTFRLLVMILLAPLAVRRLARRPRVAA